MDPVQSFVPRPTGINTMSVDVFLDICDVLDINSVLALAKTCKALHCLLQRYIWARRIRTVPLAAALEYAGEWRLESLATLFRISREVNPGFVDGESTNNEHPYSCSRSPWLPPSVQLVQLGLLEALRILEAELGSLDTPRQRYWHYQAGYPFDPLYPTGCMTMHHPKYCWGPRNYRRGLNRGGPMQKRMLFLWGLRCINLIDFAARMGRPEVTKYLLDNTKIPVRPQALCFAAMADSVDDMTVILESGRITTNDAELGLKYAFITAVLWGHDDVVSWLLQRGIHERQRFSAEVCKDLSQYEWWPPALTPLEAAVFLDHEDVVATLVKTGKHSLKQIRNVLKAAIRSEKMNGACLQLTIRSGIGAHWAELYLALISRHDWRWCYLSRLDSEQELRDRILRIIDEQRPDLNRPCEKTGQLFLERVMEAAIDTSLEDHLASWDVWIVPLLERGATLYPLADKPIFFRFFAQLAKDTDWVEGNWLATALSPQQLEECVYMPPCTLLALDTDIPGR